MLSQPPAAEVVTLQNDAIDVTTPCTGGRDCHIIHVFQVPSRHCRRVRVAHRCLPSHLAKILLYPNVSSAT